VIALPLGILKRNVVKFEPSLPEKIEAVQGLEFGNVVKIVFHFKEQTWGDFGFIHAFNEPIPTWWSDSRGAILTGWAGGPKADALRKHSRPQLETLGLNILRKILFPHDLRHLCGSNSLPVITGTGLASLTSVAPTATFL
jgi:hypothetical protein